MKFNNIFSLPCLYFPKFVALSSVLFSRLSGSGSVLGIFFFFGRDNGYTLNRIRVYILRDNYHWQVEKSTLKYKERSSFTKHRLESMWLSSSRMSHRLYGPSSREARCRARKCPRKAHGSSGPAGPSSQPPQPGNRQTRALPCRGP